MHGKQVKKKPKLTIPLPQIQNDDGTSPDTAKPTLSYTCQNPYTMSLLTSFRSDRPLSGLLNFYRSDPPPSGLSNLFRLDLPPDYKKIDKKLVSKFLWWGVYRRMDIKNSLPK